jgi:hypothetical protein
MQTYTVAIGRLDKRLGNVAIDELDARAVAGLVADLHSHGLKKQTIRKTVSVLGMILDHAGVQPNPARDRLTVKLPREERRQIQPPRGAHVEAVVHLLPTRYRLPALVLGATGMRVGELEALTWVMSTSRAAGGGSRRARPAVPAGSHHPRFSTRRCSSFARATIGCLRGRCSRDSALTASAPR